jgi:hypothetical protein
MNLWILCVLAALREVLAFLSCAFCASLWLFF